MARLYNFSAGPSALPESVLKQAASELCEYSNSGMSVMEMSHRSPSYMTIINAAEDGLRTLMKIPDNYKVLFLQGGASSQFAMVPLNLMARTGKADYINTGAWSKKAITEAKRFGQVHIVASSEDAAFNYIPELDPKTFDSDAGYFHITSNNTIYGTRISDIPETGDVPIVADMSSSILSEEIDVSRYGIIYAGAQKNIGPAGVTVVIIREDLIGNALNIAPTMFNYKIHADNASMFNTPPTYGIYIAKLVFDWLIKLGGVRGIEQINRRKATMFYNFLDLSDMFNATVAKRDRSIMNIPFTTIKNELNTKFLNEVTAAGFVNLKGHRLAGGMRASIYNAMPLDGVKKLIDFMVDFEANNR